MLILQTIRDATNASAKLRSGLFRTALPLAPDTHRLIVGIVGESLGHRNYSDNWLLIQGIGTIGKVSISFKC